MLLGMDTMDSPTDNASPAWSEADEQRRLADEVDARALGDAERCHQRTLRALRDVDGGRLIADEAIKAWADSLGRDGEVAAPRPG